MRIEVDDEVFQTLMHHSMMHDECVVLPPGLVRRRWVKVNNSLVSRGAVRTGGTYRFHPEGCAPLIVCSRFIPRRKRPPRKQLRYQRSLLQIVFERIDVKVITVVSVPVGGEPRVVEVGDDLKAMQALVGGYIEMHGIGREIALVCHEDGMALGLPQNGCGILGPYFFTRLEPLGDCVSLSPDDCAMVMAYVVSHRQVRHAGTPPQVHSFNSMDEMLEFKERQKFDADHAN